MKLRNSTVRPYFVPIGAVFLALVGCTNLPPTAVQDDLKIEQMLAAMDSCLSAQDAISTQLNLQSSQLSEQGQTLNELAQNGSVRAKEKSALNSSKGSPCIQSGDSADKLLVGRQEHVWLSNLQVSLPARVDTGAETASIDAQNIELFERDGQKWVRFDIARENSKEALSLERRLERMVTIVQSNSTEAERRPVVKLSVDIGHVSQTAEFTLSNRRHLDHQILIGRNVLQDVMVVDVSKVNIAPHKKAPKK